MKETGQFVLETIKEVTQFIEEFKNRAGNPKEIENFFLNGCCYWFAKILDERFKWQGSIVYNIQDNHFLYKIVDCYFDIRGLIKNQDDENIVNWDDYVYTDSTHYNRILKDCVYFI